jgi:hypothetical protein
MMATTTPGPLGTLDTLGPDEWQSVAAFLPFVDLGNLAKSCRAGRRIAKHVTHECDLSHLHSGWCDGESLCELFHVTPAERRALAELSAKARVAAAVRPCRSDARVMRSGPRSSWLVPSTLPHVLEVVGGWPGLKARLDERRQKKRKEAVLDDRRDAAGAKRRRTIDKWLATEKPLGGAIDTVAKWEASLEDRVGEPFLHECLVNGSAGFSAARMSPIIGRYLYGRYLYGGVLDAGKKLPNVKRALIAFDKTADDVAEYRKCHRIAITRWTDPCWHVH